MLLKGVRGDVGLEGVVRVRREDSDDLGRGGQEGGDEERSTSPSSGGMNERTCAALTSAFVWAPAMMETLRCLCRGWVEGME